MFFMMGITNGRKELEHRQTVICDVCGRYGRYQVFMTYMVLSVFFIPLFKWNKRYYVQMSCCDTVYELDPEIGAAIAHGENADIEARHLHKLDQGNQTYRYKRCEHCGYETSEDFEYCPKCGNRL